LGLFAAALLSKAVAGSLPVILIILDVYPRHRLGPGRWRGPEARRAGLEKVPFVALSLVGMVLAVQAKEEAGTLVSWARYGAMARVAQACYGVVFYLVKTLVPVGITAYYPLPDRVDWSEPRFLLSMLLVAGLSVVAIGSHRRWPGLLAVWLSYLAILAPNLGLAQVGTQIAADRYSYIASIGWVALASYALIPLIRLVERRRRNVVGAAAVGAGVVLVLMVLSWRQCRIWSNSEALWTHALTHGASRSAEAHNYLGIALFRAGKNENAITHLQESARLLPAYPDAHLNLGAALIKQGKLDTAHAALSEALRLKPGLVEAHQDLGVVLAAQNKLDEAIAQFREALRLRPDFDRARRGLEIVLQRKSQRDGRRE
jgi:hypothetical protein